MAACATIANHIQPITADHIQSHPITANHIQSQPITALGFGRAQLSTFQVLQPRDQRGEQQDGRRTAQRPPRRKQL